MSEAMIQGLITQVAMSTAKQEEERVDAQINAMDELTEDDFEKLREIRKKRLMKEAQMRAKWKVLGHGTFEEITDQQAFFKIMNGDSENVICHFFSMTNKHCPLMNQHLEKLAKNHMECKVIKINAEKSPYLVENLNIVMMPTIVCVQKGHVVKKFQGLDELGGDKFSTEWLEYCLSMTGVVTFDGPPPESPFVEGYDKFCNMSRQEGKNNIRGSDYDDGSEFWTD
jgi:hypothetical protein